MIYQECGNHRGQQRTRSSFFYFPANGSINLDVFLAYNLLHSKGSHPLKYQLISFSRFGGVREQTNTQTHSLTSYCFYRVIVASIVNVFFRFFGERLVA